jgi:DHA2 family multidrug resistance protein
VGRLMRTYDPRLFAASSFVFFAVSFFMRAQWTADSSFETFVLPQVVQGLAFSMFFVSLLAIMFDGLPPQAVPAASGLSNFMRITAGSFATSLVTTFWDRREALHQSRLADSVTLFTPAYRQALGVFHSLGLTDRQAAAAIDHTLGNQSYLLASLDIFYVSGWLAVLLIPLCWLVRRPAGGQAVAVAAD